MPPTVAVVGLVRCYLGRAWVRRCDEEGEVGLEDVA